MIKGLSIWLREALSCTPALLFGHILKKVQRYIPAFVPAIFPGLASPNIFAGIAPVTAAAEAELSSGFPFVLFLSMLS
jgi:hypothetical protein